MPLVCRLHHHSPNVSADQAASVEAGFGQLPQVNALDFRSFAPARLPLPPPAHHAEALSVVPPRRRAEPLFSLRHGGVHLPAPNGDYAAARFGADVWGVLAQATAESASRHRSHGVQAARWALLLLLPLSDRQPAAAAVTGVQSSISRPFSHTRMKPVSFHPRDQSQIHAQDTEFGCNACGPAGHGAYRAHAHIAHSHPGVFCMSSCCVCIAPIALMQEDALNADGYLLEVAVYQAGRLPVLCQRDQLSPSGAAAGSGAPAAVRTQISHQLTHADFLLTAFNLHCLASSVHR